MVYFIRFEKYVKIGYSNKPEKRVLQVQQGLPESVEVLFICKGGREKEKFFHKKFKHLKSKREWFYYSEDIISYIQNNENENIKSIYGFGEFNCNDDDNYLKKHRINCGLTLKELGNKIGITRQGMMKLENSAEKGSIRMNSIQKIAEVTNHKFQFRFYKEPEQ